MCFSVVDLLAIDLSRENCNYWYDPQSLVKLDYQVVKAQDGFEVFIRLYTVKRRQDSLSFLLQNTYTSPEHEVGAPAIDSIKHADHLLIFKLRLMEDIDNLLVIKYTDQKDYYFPIQLRYTNIEHGSVFVTSKDIGAPSFEPYHVEGDLAVESYGQVANRYVYQYKEMFHPADPPMKNSSKVSPSLKLDTLYQLDGPGMEVSGGYFYLIQDDTLSSSGLTFYVGHQYYPRLVHLDELIEPLQYITKRSEFEKMQYAGNKKRAFDEFWLSLYPIKRNASDAISSYYRSVRSANEMFTNYKPGWKTDRGMIFIVMGVPDDVERKDWTEIWSYEGRGSFEFRIISSLFAYHQYYLVRKEEYKNHWLSSVRTIRNNQ
jgi:GWxTD domain-containing protein